MLSLWLAGFSVQATVVPCSWRLAFVVGYRRSSSSELFYYISSFSPHVDWGRANPPCLHVHELKSDCGSSCTITDACLRCGKCEMKTLWLYPDLTSLNDAFDFACSTSLKCEGVFCEPHCSETTILRLINYRLIHAHCCKSSALEPLDLSPPSDVINYVIVIDRLGNKLWISRAASCSTHQTEIV